MIFNIKLTFLAKFSIEVGTNIDLINASKGWFYLVRINRKILTFDCDNLEKEAFIL